MVLSGQPLVLFRDADGHACALEDRCAHRHAPLSAGRVSDEGIECPYHGWTWDGAGRLAVLPATGERGDACRAAHASLTVPAHAVRELQGFVWVASGTGPSPPAPPLGFPHLGEPGWTSFVMRTRFDADVDTCLENFLDCPHATFVHRHWFRAPTARRVAATVTRLDDGVQATFRDEPREKSLVWWLLAPRGGQMQHTDRFVAPARSQVDYAFPNGWRYSITSSCTEVRADRTDVTTVISFRTPGIGPLVRLYFEPLSRWIIRQDVRIVALRARNRERFEACGMTARPQASVHADLLGPLVVRWRGDLAAGREPLPAARERTTEIFL